jgi:glycosyltransferase involved in cell wall biosynthesis
LAAEALSARPPPELWVDTTGWAFAYPLAKLAGCRVAAYVHYPTVSSDMIARVASREQAFNNSGGVARSGLRSAVKAAYYRLVALAYGACGGLACDAAMANSSWTLGHVARIWGPWSAARRAVERVVGGGVGGGRASSSSSSAAAAHLVYPPCDVSGLAALPLDRALKRLSLVSVAQFRPEKDHRAQLEAYALLLRAADAALGGSSGGGAGGGAGNKPAVVVAQPPPAAPIEDPALLADGMGAYLREWRRRRRRDGEVGAGPLSSSSFPSLWAGGEAAAAGGGNGGLLSGLMSWVFGAAGGADYDEGGPVAQGDDDDQSSGGSDAGTEGDEGGNNKAGKGGGNGNGPLKSLASSLLRRVGGRYLPSFLQQRGSKANAPSDAIDNAAAAADNADASEEDDDPTASSSPPLPPLVLTPAAARAARASCLRFVGSCRGADDEARLCRLQRRARELGVDGRCSWHVNADAAELKRLLGSAVGGLHSMSQEHFGISVVEYMAAGAVPVAHDSGGPRSDIVVAAWVPSEGVVVSGGGGGSAVGGGRSPSSSSGGGGSGGGGGRSSSQVQPAGLVGRLQGLAAVGAQLVFGGGRRGGASAASAGEQGTGGAGAEAAAAGDGDESYDMVDDAREAEEEDGIESDPDDYEEEDADLFEGPDGDSEAGDSDDDASDDGGATAPQPRHRRSASSGGEQQQQHNDALRLSSASRAGEERRARRSAARRRGRRRGIPPVVGFLSRGPVELAWAMARCLSLGDRARRRVAAAGRARAARLFSDARFEQAFLGAVGPVLPSVRGGGA